MFKRLICPFRNDLRLWSSFPFLITAHDHWLATLIDIYIYDLGAFSMQFVFQIFRLNSIMKQVLKLYFGHHFCTGVQHKFYYRLGEKKRFLGIFTRRNLKNLRYRNEPKKNYLTTGNLLTLCCSFFSKCNKLNK